MGHRRRHATILCEYIFNALNGVFDDHIFFLAKRPHVISPFVITNVIILFQNIMDKINQMTSVRDEETKTQYAFFNNGGLVSFDDERSICDKTEYVNDQELAGFVSSQRMIVHFPGKFQVTVQIK